jgi:hypothetical protein
MAADDSSFVYERQHYYATAFGIGIVAAALMTAALRIAEAWGLTEFDLSMTLGTVTTMTMGPTPGAWVQGFLAVLLCGGVFALLYAWVFESWPAHTARAWLGALVGVPHALLGGLMLGWLMPPLHPSTPNHPLLSDPGFMAVNYGTQTAVVFGLMHVLFGSIVGGWMHFAPYDKRYLAGVAERHAHHAPPTTPMSV